MHFRHNNRRTTYTSGNKKLQAVKEEKNLGVIMQENLKIGKQVSAAALTANSMLDMIRRSFVNRKEKMMVRLLKKICYTSSRIDHSSVGPTHGEGYIKA